MATPDYRQMARQYAAEAGIDPDVFVRQIQQESGFRTGVSSGAGAQGIAQIMPATARGWGVDPNDPQAALRAAANAMGKYVRSYKGDYAKALAAYNAGVGAVAKYGGVPPFKETQHYVKTILGGKTPAYGKPVAGRGLAGPAMGAGMPKAPANPASDPFAMMAAATRKRMGLFDDDEDDGGLAALAQGKWDMLDQMKAMRGPAPQQLAAQPDIAGGVPIGGGAPVRGGGNILPQRKGEADWQYLRRLGSSMFGLRNDPGDSQTTGGGHRRNSEHYNGRAIDFGDARNDRAKLNAWHAFLKANSKRLGIIELLDEGDHIHAAIR